ncbi:AIR carboxylase family protein [Elusimicrobiota bacterium]
MNNNYHKGISVAIVMGSENDLDHAQRIREELGKWKISSFFRIGSAHRTLSHVMSIVNELNESKDNILIISIAGGTDALSGVLAANSRWPVVSCPPNEKHVASCLGNPRGTSNATILKPVNAARFAAQYFSAREKDLLDKLFEQISQKKKEVVEADKLCVKGIKAK